jgi:hypothetical protein
MRVRCIGIGELRHARIIRHEAKTLPTREIARTENLINRPEIARQGEPKSLRSQAAGRAGQGHRLAGEVRRDHPVLRHGNRERILRSARVAAPTEKTLSRIGRGREGDGLIRGKNISDWIPVTFPCPKTSTVSAASFAGVAPKIEEIVGAGFVRVK